MRRMFHVFAEKADPKDAARILEIPVGVAFSSDNSSAFRLRIDAIPLNFDGKLIIHTDDPVSTIDDEGRKTA